MSGILAKPGIAAEPFMVSDADGDLVKGLVSRAPLRLSSPSADCLCLRLKRPIFATSVILSVIDYDPNFDARLLKKSPTGQHGAGESSI